MDEAVIKRIQPNSIEAEQSVIGSMLMDREAIVEVSDILSKDDFYYSQYGMLYEAMVSLYNEGKPVDLVTVSNKLKEMGAPDSVSSLEYVGDILAMVPTSAHAKQYAQIVQENSVRRNLIQNANQIIAGAFDDTVTSASLIEDAERRIFEVADKKHNTDYKSIADLCKPAISYIEERVKNHSDCTGIPSGYPDIDSSTTGFQDSEFIVIGARPSKGKTALAISMAVNMSLRKDVKVGFFSLEMDEMQIMQRILSGEAKVDNKKIRNGFISDIEGTKITVACGNIFNKMKMFICATPNMRLIDLRTEARKLKAKENVDIIFIDYISLITSDNREIPRHEQVAEISRSLKQLARELKIPIVVLAQVKREVKDDRPTLSDLRESGSIEQDADLVLFIHPLQKKDDDESAIGSGQEVDIIIAKNRNGPVGECKLLFFPQYTRFESMSKEKD